MEGRASWVGGYLSESAKSAEEKLRNKLASYAHEAWSGWIKYMFGKSARNSDGTITIPAWAVERWERQASTPYAELPEEEKKSDLAEADQILDIFSKGEKQCEPS